MQLLYLTIRLMKTFLSPICIGKIRREENLMDNFVFNIITLVYKKYFHANVNIYFRHFTFK